MQNVTCPCTSFRIVDSMKLFDVSSCTFEQNLWDHLSYLTVSLSRLAAGWNSS